MFNFPSRLGYCGPNFSIPSEFSSISPAWAKSQSDKILRERIYEVFTHNLAQLASIINFNIENELWVYRIPSGIFPLVEHPVGQEFWGNVILDGMYWIDTANVILRYIRLGGRISARSSIFVSPLSTNKGVQEKSLANLRYHADLLTNLTLPESAFTPIVAELSTSSLTDTHEAKRRFADFYARLPFGVQQRLALRNEQKGSWTVDKLVEVAPGIPIVLNGHHWRLNAGQFGFSDALDFAKNTWSENRPLTQWSTANGKAIASQISNEDMSSPEFYELVNSKVDIEIEAKDKDLAVFTLRERLTGI